MSENHDPLSQLWQKQQVEKPDLVAISKKWRFMRLKQRFYACLDILGLGFPIVFLYFYLDKLNRFTLIYLALIFLLLCPFVAYLLWLRRFSIGWSNTTTEQHIQTLKKQVSSNIRIAYITKHSTWVSGLFVVFHYMGLFYFDVFDIDSLVRKSLGTAGMLIVMLPGFWIWASRREQRFKSELAQLDKLFSSSLKDSSV